MSIDRPISDDNKLLLADAFEQFTQFYMPALNYSPITRRGYSFDVREFLDWITGDGARFCNDLAVDRINLYLSTLDGRGLRGNSRRRKVIAIKAFLGYLTSCKIIPTDFGSTIIWPAQEEDEPKPLSKDQYKRLLEAARGNLRDAAIFELLIQSGIRLSELTALKVADLSLPARPSPDPTKGFGIMDVKRKGRRQQTLIINYPACRALKAYLQVRPHYLKAKYADPNEQALFLNKYGKPLANRDVQRALKKYAKEAGVAWAHVHTLRTTYITHHIAKGTDIKTIQAHAGHTNLATTNRYVAYVKEASARAMQEHAL